MSQESRVDIINVMISNLIPMKDLGGGRKEQSGHGNFKHVNYK